MTPHEATYEAADAARLANYWRTVGEALEGGVRVTHEGGDWKAAGTLREEVAAARLARPPGVKWMTEKYIVCECGLDFIEYGPGLFEEQWPRPTMWERYGRHQADLARTAEWSC